MSKNNDVKKEEEPIQVKEEESKNNEEANEIKPEEQVVPEQPIPQEEPKEVEVEEPKIIPEIEESKVNNDIPENTPQKKFKRDAPLKITNNLVKARMEYSQQISTLKYMTKNQKKKEMKMTEEEKEKNRKILYNMNLKLNFKKNPRYKDNLPPPRYIDTNYQPINSPENAFAIEPQEVVFKDYQSGSIYQIDLKILNRTQLLTSFKYIPPLTEYFTIKNVIYPFGIKGIIRQTMIDVLSSFKLNIKSLLLIIVLISSFLDSLLSGIVESI